MPHGPFRKPLTPDRERRILQKRGLMPFTPLRTIHNRTRVSTTKLELLSRSFTRNMAGTIAHVKRLMQDPQKRWLLQDPRFWIIARIVELAPAQNIATIRRIMKEEKKHNPALASVKIPTDSYISTIIVENNLRTPEQAFHVRYLRRPKRRPENELSAQQRSTLQAEAVKVVSKLKLRNEPYITPEEMRSYLLEKIVEESKYWPVDPQSTDPELVAQWRKYLKYKIYGHFIKDILRKHGPVTRVAGKTRYVVPGTEWNRQGGESIEPMNPIERTVGKRIQLDRINPEQFTSLTPTEREILVKLAEGMKPKEIAIERGRTISSISQAIQRIRKKLYNE